MESVLLVLLIGLARELGASEEVGADESGDRGRGFFGLYSVGKGFIVFVN